MSPAFKKVFTPLVLLSFLIMAFFGFASMTYGPDGSMQGDCPFSNIGASLCPPSALPGAVHHINAYSSFLNVPVNLAVIFLVLASSVFVFFFLLLQYKPLALIRYVPPSLTSQERKIKRWLSLFENSPSRS